MAQTEKILTQQPIIKRKITNIGNSLGVTLPINFISSLELEKGDQIDIQVQGDSIVLKKAKPEKRIDDDLLKLIFEEMEAHDEALRELAKR